MNTKVENQKINSELTLYDSSNSPLTVYAVNLALTKKDDEIIECRLTFQVNLELYQRIDTNALFNLNPVVRISPNSVNFQPEPNIQIEASLKPDFLTHLLEHATNADEAASYLFNHNSPNTLLFTENWLGLSVKQAQNSGEIGYHTFWSHFSLLGLSMASNSQEEISAGITNFLQDLVSLGLDSATKEINPVPIGEIANFFRDLSETTSKFPSSNSNPQQPIFDAVVNFFKQDDWEFQQLEPEPVLRIHCQGQNGAWNCYAQARDTHQHFVFYSICPIKVPESKLQAIAEFITLANYDMVIGNFELELNVGEVRYKTSIHLENEELKFNTIKNLVYTNVNMMDKYLPGIMSVINGEVLPISAIKKIELIQDLSQSLDKQKQFLVDAPADSQETMVVNYSSQTDVQKQEIKRDRESHILSILTPEEIAQFHQVSQMVAPYQRKKVQEITDKLKSVIITRTGELGEEIFTRAATFFQEVKLEAKNLKLIQRYSGLAGRTRLLLQHLNNWSEQYGELPANSQGRIALVELDNLFWCIDERLQELPTDKLESKQEVKLLVEIEEFREQLGVYENSIKRLSADC